jgi:transcriptional regulator with XRE-family HTH domain
MQFCHSFLGVPFPAKLKYMSQFSKNMKNKNRKPIVNSLRRYRKARGLKQKEVAAVLGLKTASTISRWENGLCLPKLHSLFKLAILYRTMVDALFIDLRMLLKEEVMKAERLYRQKSPADRAYP